MVLLLTSTDVSPITSLQREGNNFVGKARLLDTPMGNIAKSLLDEGVKLGVSSRGLGSIKEEGGIKVVADDFMLATAADIVVILPPLTLLSMALWKEKSGSMLEAQSKSKESSKSSKELITHTALSWMR